MRLRRERERRAACRAAAPRRCRRALFPTGTLACGRFGIVEQPAVAPLLDRRRARRSSCLICCARCRLASWIFVVSSPCRFARATSSPAAFCSRFSPSSSGSSRRRRDFERRQLLELGGQVDAALLQRGADGVEVVAEKRGIEHRASILHQVPGLRWHAWPARSARPSSPPPASARGSCPPPRRSRRRCWSSSTSRSSSTASRRRSQSGVDNIVIVTGRGKNAIEDHFDVAVELESFLEQRGKTEQLEEIRKITRLINVAYVRQGEPLGLGHAVLVTKNLVGDEPFAVILGDDVIDATPPALKQMIDVYRARRTGRCSPSSACPTRTSRATASSRSTRAPTSGRGVHRITDLVEKPRREDAPSNLAIIGRYILTPDIFPALEATAQRSHRRDPADQRAAPAAAASGRSTRARSTASATTPATSSDS